MASIRCLLECRLSASRRLFHNMYGRLMEGRMDDPVVLFLFVCLLYMGGAVSNLVRFRSLESGCS
jgi:hypothetical protein